MVRVYRFLSSSMPTIAIAMIIATVAAARYISVGGNDNVGSDTADGASDTPTEVSAYELQ